MTADGLYDPFVPEVLADPYPAYRRLRDTQPALWHERLGGWVLTRYDDCLAVLQDAERFANDFRRVGIPTPAPLLNLQTLDPPEQTPLRNAAVAALRAQDLPALAKRAAIRATTLLRDLAVREKVDLVRDFIDPFTLAIICDLLGVEQPQPDAAWVRLNDDLDRSMDSRLVPGSEEAGLRARALFSALVASWLAAKPTTGLLGDIVARRASLDANETVLINSVRAFWHAGFEVPARFLGNALLALLKDRATMAALRQMDARDVAIDELVRYAGPVHMLARACTQDTQLGGQRIARGELVFSVIAAANRDPEQFERAEELVLDRRSNPHLGFGRGAHSCLGLQVAKMEAEIAISAVLDHYPEIDLAGEPSFRSNATLRGLASLPVTLRAKQHPDPTLQRRPGARRAAALQPAVVNLQAGVAARGLLSRSAFFTLLPPAALDELAARLRRCEVEAGSIVVREGEEPGAYYLIDQGVAEVWQARPGVREASVDPDPSRHTLLARLGPSDGFGEMALLWGGGRRATVRAASPLVLYLLDGEAFKTTVNQYRGLAVALEREMTLRAVSASLGRSSPFASLPPEALRWLALRLQPLPIEPGDEVVREGEPGDAFYIVAQGEVEVVRCRADGVETQLSTLGPGGCSASSRCSATSRDRQLSAR